MKQLERKAKGIAKRLVREHGFTKKDQPGVAVLIKHNNQTIVNYCFGQEDREANIAITPRSRFDLASCSKHFVCVSLLLLHSRGLIDLEESLESYLPEFEKFGITLLNCIHHTSGLKDYLEIDVDFETNEHVVQVLSETELMFEPGEKHDYSNSNYAVLAAIIEKISGKRWSQFMAEEIFGPLNMNESLVIDNTTSCLVENSQVTEKIPNRCVGYQEDEDENLIIASQDLNVTGDGGVLTTIHDLAIWDTAMNKKFSDLGIDAKQFDDYFFVGGSCTNGEEHGYSFGFFDIPSSDLLDLNFPEEVVQAGAYLHNGSWTGTSTAYVKLMNPNITVIVLCNQEDRDVTQLAGEIAEAVLVSLQE